MRPVAFGEAFPAGTRVTLVSNDKPNRFFTVIKFWMDKTSGVALDLKTGVPSYKVEDGLPRRRSASAGLRRDKLCRRREEGRTHLLIHLPIEKTDTEGVSGGPITQALIPGPFLDGALVEE